MADNADQAADYQAQHLARSLAKVGKPVAEPTMGFCESCCEEPVPVLPRGGIMRCTDCRSRWEKRK